MTDETLSRMVNASRRSAAEVLRGMIESGEMLPGTSVQHAIRILVCRGVNLTGTTPEGWDRIEGGGETHGS
jgi:hypothetical protein